MKLFEKIRLLTEYAPLLTYMQDLVSDDDIHAKAVVASEAARWLAEKTDFTWDEELIELVGDIIKSDEGEALVRWIVEQSKPDDSNG